MRLFLIAHGLWNRTGHHYMEARAFKEEAAKRHLTGVILAHCDISPSVRDELDALPLFRHTPYKPLFRRRYLGLLLDFLFFGRAMRQRLLSLPADEITAEDILVCPLTRAHEMLGLAWWLARVPRKQHPFFAINFMVDDFFQGVSKTKLRTISIKPSRLYRAAFNLLKKRLASDRLLLSAGGTSFARTMSRMLNHPVEVFPLPVQHEFTSATTVKSLPQQSPLIAFVGSMRKDKGADLVGAVIQRVLLENPGCRFFLQANPLSWEERWMNDIGTAGKTRVHIHRGEMTQEEYQNTIKMADIVLLPYHSGQYTLQTSGVFSEAMAMGKVSVIPEGTWMADMVHKFKGGGILYPRQEVAAIAEATLEALARLPQLTRDMQDISGVWRETMGMKAFLQRILDKAAT